VRGRKLKEVRDGSNGSRTLSKRNRMDGWMVGIVSMTVNRVFRVFCFRFSLSMC